MKTGKLYICEEYFLLLYPDPETAAAGATAVGGTAEAAAAADYWSNRFGKPVYYAEKKVPLLVLNNKKEYIEVLAGDKKGWIIYADWLELKEIQ